MRIAHVTSNLDRSAAGVVAVVSALSAEQHLAGHEVVVFGLNTRAWEDGDKNHWDGAPVEVFRVAEPKSFGYAPELLKRLIAFNPEIIHLHGLWTYPAIAVLRWHLRTKRPYVYSPHGMLSPVALQYSTIKKFVALRLFQNSALAKSCVLHATSDLESQELKRFGLKNKIEVVPLGIQAVNVPILPPEASLRVLSLGRFHPKKGLARLIKAWSKLENLFPDWSLDLVGPDEVGHMAELEGLIKNLNLKRVLIRPAVHGPERDICLAGAEVFVLPTLGENFGLTVLESLMMETPVIATKGAPWSGLQTEGCGWWVEQGVEPLLKALVEAMSLTSQQRHQLGQIGREWVLRDYAWNLLSFKMVEIYESAI